MKRIGMILQDNSAIDFFDSFQNDQRLLTSIERPHSWK
jgi:hypothetical protein